ncbi:hypothetical protein ADUPG1_012471, partial [Aduncisulcus paluster]
MRFIQKWPPKFVKVLPHGVDISNPNITQNEPSKLSILIIIATSLIILFLGLCTLHPFSARSSRSSSCVSARHIQQSFIDSDGISQSHLNDIDIQTAPHGGFLTSSEPHFQVILSFFIMLPMLLFIPKSHKRTRKVCQTMGSMTISSSSNCSILSILIFLVALSSSFQSVFGYGFSEECSMYISGDDHMTCNELYPGRYAAECDDGYYYDESSYTRKCVYDSAKKCPLYVSGHHMCVLSTDEDSSPSLGCRSAWYGDDCDQLYSVHIPDKLFREKVCDAAGYGEMLCDVTEFEMARISGYFNASISNILTFEGSQYLINNSLCRSESDDAYWSFIRSVFPIHNSSTSKVHFDTSKDRNYLPNNCPLNEKPGNRPYSCDPNIKSECPSIVLNGVYNSVDGVNKKQCAFIAKEGINGECYTVHDDNIRAFLSEPSNGCLSSSDIETNGVISVATLRSSLRCSSLNLSTIARSMGLSSVNDITTLQGLEYAQGTDSSNNPEGINGECYTVHDDNIRAFLSEPSNGCLSSSDIETNGVISVATLRSSLRCSSLNLSTIARSMGLSSVNDITTLQGLEYAQGTDSSNNPVGLTTLNIDGYDLSGDVNPNAEYDKLVVQILAKAVIRSNDYGNIDSGLTSLSASGCGLSDVSDVLDLTPIVEGDDATRPFKLTSLDLSNNSIPDVSVLITSSMFPSDTLTSLNISGNSICDIDNVVSRLQSYFTNLSSIVSHEQSTCPCYDSEFGTDVSFSAHKTCRQRSDGEFQVECWHGYFLDKTTNTCVKAKTTEESIRCQVCERKDDDVVPTLEVGASYITCGCRSGFHGDTYEYVYIPDSNLRSAVCLSVVNPTAHDSSCDDLTLSDMTTVTSVHASIVDSLEGLQHAVNLTSLSISGTSSSSVSIGNTDLGYLPLSLVELSLEAVYLAADSDFSIFPNLTTLSLNDNPSYDLTNSALFPSSSSSSSSTFTSLDVSYTALSSFSSIPTSITTLTANNCSSLTSFSTISNLTNLVSLDVSYASNVLDFSSLLSSPPTSISILYADGCNVSPDTDFTSFTNLTTLSLNDNPSYDLTNSALFPSSSSSSSSTFTSLDVSYTALSSFSSIPTSITTLTANNCSSLTSFSTISNLTNLVSLDV